MGRSDTMTARHEDDMDSDVGSLCVYGTLCAVVPYVSCFRLLTQAE
jgi:hypothetical protein